MSVSFMVYCVFAAVCYLAWLIVPMWNEGCFDELVEAMHEFRNKFWNNYVMGHFH